MPTRDYHHEHFKTLDSIAIPSISRTVGVSLCLGTAALIAFLILTPWVQTTQGPGRVTALNPNDRLQEINALVTGRIQEWFVRDGSRDRRFGRSMDLRSRWSQMSAETWERYGGWQEFFACLLNFAKIFF